MITEDYVSFEVAKLLKEKGFDEFTFSNYNENGIIQFNEVETRVAKGYQRPTHQMALKWLRKVYHCHVIIGYVFKADAKLTNDYVSYCYSVENANTFVEFTQDEWYDSYEEAIEASLLYVLKNLI
jgi:hypothetical protein